MSKVAILMGSLTDRTLVEPAAKTLAELGIGVEWHVMSAHRTPERVAEFVRGAEAAGIRVFIAAAGGAAHLAGAVAAHTTRPVIGLPLGRSLGGLDSLYATVQMPPGVPVATVAVDGALNAALLAAQMLGLAEEGLAGRVRTRRAADRKKAEDADAELQRLWQQPDPGTGKA
jgi:5-(carboxyamino)imidazole ribonucleotide mutase